MRRLNGTGSVKGVVSVAAVMDQATTLAIVAIVVAAGSKVIGLLPIRENSWVQLVIKALKVVFPKK